MQLITSTPKKTAKHSVNVRWALAAASANLLAAGSLHAEENPWLVDSGLLIYSEANGRVSATEPIVSLRKDFGDEHILGLKFTYDSLTGASPSGALPSKETVTYTSASRGTTTTTTASNLPLGPFEDTRSAFNASWEQPLGENYHATIGGSYSHENDYVSTSINAAIARDFNEKNTTLSLGFNVESDKSNPIGGIPKAMSWSSLSQTGIESETKTVNDVLLGVSQVMNRYWLTQLNYSYSTSSGYQNDPYKILSVVDSNGTALNDPELFDQPLLIHENRPDKRTRQSLFWGNKIHLSDMEILDASFRHYTDDWGITAETVDLRYRVQMTKHLYFEPHYRYYTQTAADFYKAFLVSGTDVIQGVSQRQFATADYRLAAYSASTYGLKVGYALGENSEVNIRFEHYKQSGKSAPDEAKNMHALSGLDLFQGVAANTLMVGYSFEF